MYRHTPVNLRGPFTRNQPWWQFPAPVPKSAGGSLCVLSPAAAAESRLDLVARVRREIAEGTYDTPEKWDAALQRLLARLGQT